MSGSFLDQQASIGISVHLGGLPATRRLLALCHVAEAREVLDVGCGIGVGPTVIARTYGCRVVGVDRSPRMIDWARRQAREQGVEDRVSLLVADVLALPFEDDRFDVVIAESVLAFLADKEHALAEMVRVTKPGGYVGLNEGFLLIEMPSPRVTALADRIGIGRATQRTWRVLWGASGLDERVIRTYRIDAARELRDRFRWVGLRRLVAGSMHAVRLYLTEPSARPLLDAMLVSLRAGTDDEPGAPPPWASFGYGLFAGRKPADARRIGRQRASGSSDDPSGTGTRKASGRDSA